jgi:hypothetical protein
MVDVITPTKTLFGKGKTPVIKLEFAGIDGAGEYGIFDAWSEYLGFIPTAASCIVTRTGGTTSAIDVDVNVSMDNTTYVASDINNITAQLTYDHMPSPDWGEPDDTARIAWRYWKPIAVDEGSGNTLTITLWLY